MSPDRLTDAERAINGLPSNEREALRTAWLRWTSSAPEHDVPPRRAHDAAQTIWLAAKRFYEPAALPRGDEGLREALRESDDTLRAFLRGFDGGDANDPQWRPLILAADTLLREHSALAAAPVASREDGA